MDDKNTLLILNTIEKFRNEVTTRFDAQDKILDEHTKILDEHTKILDKHSKMLDAQDKILDKHSKMLDEQNIKIDAQGKILDSHDTDFKEIKERLTSLENTVTRIETVFGDKIQLGLEHHSIIIEQHEKTMQMFDKINSKLDNHDLHIEVLEEKVF